MSLRHILNDEPPPVHSRQPYPASSRLPPGDPPIYHDDRPLSPRPPSPNEPYLSPRHSRDTVASRPYYRPPAQYEPSWDSRSGDWTPEERPVVDKERRQYSYDEDHAPSPVEPQHNHSVAPEPDVVSKKKRKAADKDADYLPTKPRRVCISMHVLLML